MQLHFNRLDLNYNSKSKFNPFYKMLNMQEIEIC